jgi:hypothetical protein
MMDGFANCNLFAIVLRPTGMPRSEEAVSSDLDGGWVRLIEVLIPPLTVILGSSVR